MKDILSAIARWALRQWAHSMKIDIFIEFPRLKTELYLHKKCDFKKRDNSKLLQI